MQQYLELMRHVRENGTFKEMFSDAQKRYNLYGRVVRYKWEQK